MGLGVFLFLSPISSFSKVFYAKDEALKVAFPEADRVEMRTFILKNAEIQRAEQLARARIESKLFTFYVGKKAGAVIGYAAIDTHTVRTLPETFMVVLSPEGRVRTALILAFHEPLEYLPTERWYEQFAQKSLADALRVGGDVHGIVGATLSAQATARGVRRALALHAVLVEKGR